MVKNMNRIKKFISFILSLTMMISIVTTVSASEIESPVTPTIGIGDMETGNFTEIDQLGEATYYVQKTDDYTVAIGIYNTFVDCSVYYHDTNSLSTAVVPVEKISGIFPKTRSDNIQAVQFEIIKRALLKGSLPLEKIDFQNHNMPFSYATRVNPSKKSKIMTELYNAGWPHAYTNYLRASKKQNGVTAKLYHTLSYSINDYDYTFFIAKTALSALLAFTGLPKERLKLIVTIALTADGIYQTIKDVYIGKYDVYAYENKTVIIKGIQPYWSGRTVKWTAVTGDIGAALTFDYENRHNDFYDNNKILDTGLRNYKDM